ncbi:MAG TPA: undecaprenyl-diphosphate phosphatase [Acidobacteriaceae bacterium]|jgi:undecaprenyl-diphosphatase|nr:undecaprenyl-diphosphate phosphatase [Acidobacteriaceae bacterium]
MLIYQVIVLALVQGLAELLPVSSSAHVVVAEKLMGLDPSTPQMTLLLVMLHTGTMFAVIAYFWQQWKQTYFSSSDAFKRFAIRLIWATLLTGILGEILIKLVEHTMFRGAPKAEIEELFGRLDLVAPALLCAGVLILIAGFRERKLDRAAAVRSAATMPESITRRPSGTVTMRQAGWMGLVQGLCLPFRGFSRSGATISTGMLTDAPKDRAERFSFAMAVAITPLAIAREAMRLLHATHQAAATGSPVDLHGTVLFSLLGAVFAFFAGLVALKWLSNWLENGRWFLFGIYCLVASGVVFWLHTRGY